MRGNCQTFYTLIFLGLAAVLIFPALSVRAQEAEEVEDVAAPFLQSLKVSPYNFSFIREGLLSVSWIEFSRDENLYYRSTNHMVLAEAIKDSEGRIKPFNKIDFTTVAHESFHAYFNNVLPVKDPASYEWVRQRARVLYPHLSSRQAFDALQESYAQFIESVLTGSRDVYDAISSPSRNCQLRLQSARRNWDLVWVGDINGYYMRPPVVDFVETAFGAPKKLIFEGWTAFHDYLHRDTVQYENEVSLPLLDRQWIARRLFENQIKKSFDQTFEVGIAIAQCSIRPTIASK